MGKAKAPTKKTPAIKKPASKKKPKPKTKNIEISVWVNNGDEPIELRKKIRESDIQKEVKKIVKEGFCDETSNLPAKIIHYPPHRIRKIEIPKDTQ